MPSKSENANPLLRIATACANPRPGSGARVCVPGKAPRQHRQRVQLGYFSAPMAVCPRLVAGHPVTLRRSRPTPNMLNGASLPRFRQRAPLSSARAPSSLGRATAACWGAPEREHHVELARVGPVVAERQRVRYAWRSAERDSRRKIRVRRVDVGRPERDAWQRPRWEIGGGNRGQTLGPRRANGKRPGGSTACGDFGERVAQALVPA